MDKQKLQAKTLKPEIISVTLQIKHQAGLVAEEGGLCWVTKGDAVQLGLAEDPVGCGLQMIDLKTDPCSRAPLFSMRAVITEPADVETRHRTRVCELTGLRWLHRSTCRQLISLRWKIPLQSFRYNLHSRCHEVKHHMKHLKHIKFTS